MTHTAVTACDPARRMNFSKSRLMSPAGPLFAPKPLENAMRKLVISVSLLSLAIMPACGGGLSGMFKGKGTGTPVATKDVKTYQSAEYVNGSYTELGTARGQGPSAQEAIDMARLHCGKNGGNTLIMNTDPFQSGGGWRADATCATQ